jgi:hypothetical protein
MPVRGVATKVRDWEEEKEKGARCGGWWVVWHSTMLESTAFNQGKWSTRELLHHPTISKMVMGWEEEPACGRSKGGLKTLHGRCC